MPRWLSLGFQDRASFSIGELSCLHDHAMVIMTRVIILISYMIIISCKSQFFYKIWSEGTLVECIWSVVPALLLLVLVVPSIRVLYLVEDTKSPSLSFKVIAHQWYWTYVVPFSQNLFNSLSNITLRGFSYDSMMDVYREGRESPRLLGASSDLVFPVGLTSRIIISSSDVIHSFAVPSLGLKVDAFPGRINQLFVNPSRLGAFYGQCSEICGSNHSFMPIRVKILSLESYFIFSYSLALESLVGLD